MDDTRSQCIFCRLADHDIPTNVLYEDEEIMAFADASPRAPVHILIIPKAHLASLAEATADQALLLGRMLLVAKNLAEQHGISESGYRVLTNCRADSGQEVPHLHLHLIGGRALGAFTHEEEVL